MSAPAGRRTRVLAAIVAGALAIRGLVTLVGLAREAAALRPVALARALARPLAERQAAELVLPAGSLGELPAESLGPEVFDVLRRETEPACGIFLLQRDSPSAFRLVVRLSAWLDPRILVDVRDPAPSWAPTYDHPGTREYVLDLAGSGAADWKRRAELVGRGAAWELWRLEERP
jgi:hypothetical protein